MGTIYSAVATVLPGTGPLPAEARTPPLRLGQLRQSLAARLLLRAKLLLPVWGYAGCERQALRWEQAPCPAHFPPRLLGTCPDVTWTQTPPLRLED